MPQRVSIHGGHSGQFCSHAEGALEDIVKAYIAQGFAWVGITEHMPVVADRYLYSEEKEAGLTAKDTEARFDLYMTEARRLQALYADRVDIFVGLETEAYSGALVRTRDLIEKYRPDYVVGSLHHINDIAFDGSPDAYQRAIVSVGGLEALYCRYFDEQHDLIQRVEPQVIGHFDLIRLFDADYANTIKRPVVWERIQRNLGLIRQMDLILDFNLAAWRKGAQEPYLCRPILEQARKLGIAVVPGDDSHGIATVGKHLDAGIALLQTMGFDTRWRRPAAPVK